MKFLLLLCVFFSTSLYANDLIGTWYNCDSSEKNIHFGHVIEFDKNNLEIEVHVAHEPSSKPCGGKVIMLIGSNWHYESDGERFKSMLFTTNATLLDQKSVNLFNRKKICGNSKWELDKREDCTNKKQNGFLLPVGYKSEHKYFIRENELEATTEDGEILIYKKEVKAITQRSKRD